MGEGYSSKNKEEIQVHRTRYINLLIESLSKVKSVLQ
jgi:hypothetical protein